MKENSIEKTLENIQNVDLITLLRKFKKEGVENFITIRRNDFDEILSDYKRVSKENEELKERNEYYIPKSVIQDKIEEIINNSTFGCVGCEWNDIEVVQLLENMLLDRRDK